MKMDDAVQVIKPAPDSHYRLVPCKCGSDNVAYVLGTDGRWRVQCFDCGHTLMTSPGHIDEEYFCCHCGADMRGEGDA